MEHLTYGDSPPQNPLIRTLPRQDIIGRPWEQILHSGTSRSPKLEMCNFAGLDAGHPQIIETFVLCTFVLCTFISGRDFENECFRPKFGPPKVAPILPCVLLASASLRLAHSWSQSPSERRFVPSLLRMTDRPCAGWSRVQNTESGEVQSHPHVVYLARQADA